MAMARTPLLRAASVVAGLLLLSAPVAGARERSLDSDVLHELNLARTQPQAYARALQEVANLSRASGAYDDPAAYSEAVAFLMRQPALPPLGADQALEGAALAHADYQGPQGGFGHEGGGEESLSDRLHHHGAYAMMMAEDISYGYRNPREVVLQLIVDAGVPSRGHRANIFNPAFREAGVACGPHRVYGAMCVVDFAGTMMRR
jgi:uncharacterized protein YkwD